MQRTTWTAALAVLLAIPALAQPAAETEPDELTAEVAKLNDHLEELVKLVRQQVEGQTLDLLVQRIQLSAERVQQTERDLRAARQRRESQAEEKVQLEDRMKMFEDQVDRGHIEEAELEAFTKQIETSLQRLETRLRSADREIAELEAALGLQRQDLREWQEFVDQRLGDL